MLTVLGMPSLPLLPPLPPLCIAPLQLKTLAPFNTAFSERARSAPSPALTHACPRASLAVILASGPSGVMSAPTSPLASAETPPQAGPEVSGAEGWTAAARVAVRGGEPDRRVWRIAPKAYMSAGAPWGSSRIISGAQNAMKGVGGGEVGVSVS